MNIGPHKLDGKRTFIIAEAGTNHSDPIPRERKGKALNYVELAKEFGADAVKFQIFSRDALFCPIEGDHARMVRWEKSRDMKLPAYKVASRAAKSYPYREMPGPFLISNGFGFKLRVPNSITLQCSAKYPSTVRWGGKHPGFSDHSGSEWTGIEAMARGLSLLEVHFVRDLTSNHGGPDRAVCLNPLQMKRLCKARDAFFEMRTH
jgi:sialic acid synthase SpsE